MHHHLQHHHHHHQCWPYPYLHDHGWLTGGRRFRPCVSSPPGFYFMERLKDFTQLCGRIKEVLDFFLLLLRNICSSEIFAFHHHHHTLHHHHRHHHLKAIVGPASKFHDTGLLVEGEVLHVHLAGGVVDGRRLPLHQPGVEQRGLGRQRHLEVAVSAKNWRNIECK